MSSSLTVQLNGRPRTFEQHVAPLPLDTLLSALDLKPDRIAVELNGIIAPRSQWSSIQVSDGDKLEIVHFVGGGLSFVGGGLSFVG